MPEFILNLEGAPPAWDSLDDFTKGFVEAAFFSETSCFDSSEFFTPAAQHAVSEGQADGAIPSDAGPSDIEPSMLAKVQGFCADFQRRAAALLAEAYALDYDATQAGRDLYFTYAGHGVGYWSRDVLEPSGDAWEETQIPLDRWTPAMRATRERLKAESIGQRLSDACGRGEISLTAYESEGAPCGFYVDFYIG